MPENPPRDRPGKSAMAQPTMRQVAELAGVSTALVSLVMRDAPNVSDYRRQRVLEAADRLGYRPNVLARNLASRRTNTLGVVLNDLHNPFFAEIVDGIQEAADAAGFRVLLGDGRHSQAGESNAVETFLQFRVDGVVIVGPWLEVSAMERASKSAAIVVVGRDADTDCFDTVNTDEFVGSTLAVEHLIDLGHRNIAHLGGGAGAGAAGRQHGYEATMRAHGLEQHIVSAAADYSESGGYDAAGQLLVAPNDITAIFAANDLSAVGAMSRIEELGLSVPGDISIVGYDNTALAAMRHTSLTTVDQPTEDLGRLATNLLIERVNGRTDVIHHVIPPTLHARATSTAPTNGT